MPSCNELARLDGRDWKVHAVDPPPISFENNTLLRMGLSNQKGVDLMGRIHYRLYILIGSCHEDLLEVK